MYTGVFAFQVWWHVSSLASMTAMSFQTFFCYQPECVNIYTGLKLRGDAGDGILLVERKMTKSIPSVNLWIYLWIINFVYYVKLIMHTKCQNALLMIIYELNNGDWPVRTWYCNKLHTSRSNFIFFCAKWFKRN